MFITFDGGDACGKSTQIKLLAEDFARRGIETVLCRDPGSTSLGDAVRNILLDSRELKICDRSEMLLFMAARAQLVEEVIRPALAAGKTILSDRFLASNIAYQGYGGKVPVSLLKELGEIVTEGLKPDRGFILDLPYEQAMRRLGNRGPSDRMERKGREYHERVREGFLRIAEEDPRRFTIIDAACPIEEVHGKIREVLNDPFDPGTGART